MLSKTEKKKQETEREWEKHQESKQGRADASWTRGLWLLNGHATDEQYRKNQNTFYSYDGDFTIVRPHSRPEAISGKAALKAYNRESEQGDVPCQKPRESVQKARQCA